MNWQTLCEGLLTQVLSLASISLLIATLLVHQREDEHEQLGEACSATADCGDAEVIESTLMTFS